MNNDKNIDPSFIPNGTLTGESRYRFSFWGKVILQLEYYNTYPCRKTGNLKIIGKEWRDATSNDLKINLKK